MMTLLPLRHFCTALLLLLVAAPALAQESKPWTAWRATLHRDHPLVGKIWSAREDRFVSPEELAEAARAARFLLLGEVHDNPDAHALQAWLIGRASQDRNPPVVMEMIGADQRDALRSYLAKPQASAAGLGDALGWAARGWPDWTIYQPIAEAALSKGLTIHAGDIDKPVLMKVGREGLAAAIPEEERQALLLETPLGTAFDEALLDELFDSHCELMPRAALASMSGVQRLRDAVLADSLLGAAGEDGAILIAGNGHIRTDRAVPWYLARRAPGVKILSVMMLEVTPDAKEPADLVPKDPDGKPALDYAWFTPRAEREDPCEGLRKRFGKKKPG